MAFCSNCGNELQDGAKFCPNCGAAVIGNATANNEAKMDSKSTPEASVQNDKEQNGKQAIGFDKYGKYLGIALLIVAIICCFTDPPLVTIIIALLVIAGSIFGLAKKYRLKGFSILALIIAAICLLAGLGQAKKYGLFSILGNDNKTAVTTENSKINSAESSKEDKSSSGSKTAQFSKTKSEDNNSAKEEQPANSGVDPDLKAFLDSYETFVDEYVDFMKKYSADPSNALSMLGEYSEMMTKYADFAEKVDKYNSKEMSTEDAKYYLEVTTRCSQKMLDIYGN